ncbi:MAG: carboxypeptidase-like regulatory domain-containing protein [Planctomycetota bacterium]
MPRSLAAVLAVLCLGAAAVLTLLSGDRGAGSSAPTAPGDEASIARRPQAELEHVPAVEAEQRAEVAVEPAPAAEDPGAARLRITVVSEVTGRPLAGVLVRVARKGEATSIELPGPGEETGRDGLRVVDAPTGVELQVALGDFRYRAGQMHFTSPLAAGEERELRLAYPEPTPYVLRGRAAGREQGEPVAGARLEVRRLGDDELLDSTESDDSGYVEVSVATWGGVYGRIDAEGYTSLFLHPAAEVAAAEGGEVRLRLARAAYLYGRVDGVREGPLAGVQVQGLLNGRDLFDPDGTGPPPGFSRPLAPTAVTAADGTYELAVPALARMLVRLLRGGETVRQEPTRWALGASEAREANWTLGTAARVFGRVVDQHGKPVAGLPVMLYEARGARARYLRRANPGSVVASCVSEDDGAFDLGGVPPGRFVLGPVPRDESPEDVARFLEELHVTGAQPELARELVVWRGLYITGTVELPDGSPVPGSEVSGWPEGADGVLSATATDTAGGFRLGPLVPGTIGLEAEYQGYGIWNAVEVEAGAQDVRLILSRGGSISGRAVPAVEDATVRVLPTDGTETSGFIVSFGLDEDGTFSIDSLAPGWYDVVIVAGEGEGGEVLIGYETGIETRAGAEVSGVEVELRPAGNVRVRYEGDLTGVRARLYSGDNVRFDVIDLPPGDPVLVSVPPFYVRIRAEDKAAGYAEETTVELAAMESYEVVFPLDR